MTFDVVDERNQQPYHLNDDGWGSTDELEMQKQSALAKLKERQSALAAHCINVPSS